MPTTGGPAPAEILGPIKLFEAAMDEDLNTPAALAALFSMVNLGHRILESQSSEKLFVAKFVHDLLIKCGMTLGLFEHGLSEENAATRSEIEKKIEERAEARKRKDFERADVIRQELFDRGFLLTDTAGKTLWRRKAQSS
jgi:cysteinyl-tRNA synthetase